MRLSWPGLGNLPLRHGRSLHRAEQASQRIARRWVGAGVDTLGPEVALKGLDDALRSTAIGARHLHAVAEGGKILLELGNALALIAEPQP